MSTVERFIVRHRLARYVFVLATWPCVAIADRVRGIWNPADLHGLRTALGWARRGGEPGVRPERPSPAPVSPRWRSDSERQASD